MTTPPFDPTRDLILERVVDLTPEELWAGWTQPEHITQWFTPVPWKTPEAETEVRPGGMFRTIMESPEGDRVDNAACYLEVDEPHRLVWTAGLGPGFRPKEFAEGDFPFTVELTFEPVDGGTKYTARAMHATVEAATIHAHMHFVDGWGMALDQLVAYMHSRR
jgi:uncharacterized protein YndB with AHSA1/START domain